MAKKGLTKSVLVQKVAEIRHVRGKGRAVFALKRIPANTIVERCPVIVVPMPEIDDLDKTIVGHYVYEWSHYDDPKDDDRMNFAVVLGWSSLFNHADEGKANIGCYDELKKKNMVFYTIKDIAPGEELCIDYGIELWFDKV